jgi:L-aspartate oxidase
VQEFEAYLAPFRVGGNQDLSVLRTDLKRAANRNLLVVRNDAGLRSFVAHCEATRAAAQSDARIAGPEDLLAALELVNLCEVGAIMGKAALVRTESRGSHYREDFPETDTTQMENVIIDQAHPQGWFRAKIGELAAE